MPVTIKKNKQSSIFKPGLKLDMYSHDVDEMTEQSVYWEYEQRQFARGRFRGHILAFHTANLQISLAYRTPGFQIMGGMPDNFSCFVFPVSFDSKFFYRGSFLLDNQVVALSQHDEIELQTGKPSAILAVASSSDLINHYSSVLTGKTFEDLRVQERLFMQPQKYQDVSYRLVSLIHSLCERTLALTDREEERLESEIMELIFSALDTQQIKIKKQDRLLIAQKAEKLIIERLDECLPISAVCALLEVPERTMYLAFKERFGVSPKAYALMMRLHEASRELRQRSSSKSVSDIAMQWGFYHLGRFSEQYKRMFAELPSETRMKCYR